MKQQEFEKEYFGEWTEVQKTPLEKLPEEYCRELDSFDAKICSIVDRYGDPMPKDSWERSQCSKNAKKVRAIYNEKALMLGFQIHEFTKAVQKVNQTNNQKTC